MAFFPYPFLKRASPKALSLTFKVGASLVLEFTKTFGKYFEISYVVPKIFIRFGPMILLSSSSLATVQRKLGFRLSLQ